MMTFFLSSLPEVAGECHAEPVEAWQQKTVSHFGKLSVTVLNARRGVGVSPAIQ
jgi:hypothetical protein